MTRTKAPAAAGERREDASAAVVLLRAFVDVMPEPVIAVTGDIRVIAYNAPAQFLLPALRIGDLLALALRSPDVLDAIRRVRAEHGKPETITWRERVPLERLFEVNLASLSPPVLPKVVVLTLRDLTEAHRVERMRVDFVANASHELRTPLASLLGFVETLQGPARDDERAREKFLIIMGEQARRMARLVDDLLSLSRIEQNLHLQPKAPVDLAAVIQHTVDALSPLARENRVTVKVAAPKPVIVVGDRDELVRVAENLIENAIKYGHATRAAVVEVSVETVGAQGRLTVRDQGPGIPPEHLPRLTERFYRVDAGASRAKGGTGLGLAIVKHIVARHRGRLSITSTPGQGATFRADFPLSED